MKALKKLKLNSKGFSHVELLLVIVVVVAIAGVGVFVYKHDHKTTKSSVAILTNKPLVSSTPVKGSSLTGMLPAASAYNLSHITTKAGGYDIYACKQSIPAYGVWHIIAYYYIPTSVYGHVAAWLIDYESNGSVKQSYAATTDFYYHTVAGLTMNVSAFSSDTIKFEEQGQPNTIISNSFTVSQFSADVVSC